MHRLGIVLHPTRSDAGLFDRFRLDTADLEVVGLQRDAGRLPAWVTVLAEDAFAATVDSVVSLGGDGTMLGAMRLVAARPVPVLGVNLGHLGFLVEVVPSELDDALARLEANRFVIEDHHGLRVSSADGSSRMAFNDVVLSRDRGSTVVADLQLGASQYGYYRCDAVVVATPHGSTAYNFAAGGPVVSPAASVFVVTPVAPMSGISRAVVLDGSELVRLTPSPDGDDVPLEVDGTDAGRLAAGETVTLELVRGAGQVVRLDPDRHAARNRVKLSLQDLPLRQDQLLELVPPHLRPVARPSPGGAGEPAGDVADRGGQLG